MIKAGAAVEPAEVEAAGFDAVEAAKATARGEDFGASFPTSQRVELELVSSPIDNGVATGPSSVDEAADDDVEAVAHMQCRTEANSASVRHSAFFLMSEDNRAICVFT